MGLAMRLRLIWANYIWIYQDRTAELLNVQVER